MAKAIDYSRRRFVSMASVMVAAAPFGVIGREKTKHREAVTRTPTRASSFGVLKQIDAGVLNIGYAETGPHDGRPVLLLHGWPYDIHSFVDVAPLLAAKGYRVIVPHLRGYGSTRFLSKETLRNGQQSAVALDIIALMDALKIQQAIPIPMRKDFPASTCTGPFAVVLVTTYRRRRQRHSPTRSSRPMVSN